MATMYEVFSSLEDPRVPGRSLHLLTDILILSVLAVICGAESYDSIELFGKLHHKRLKKFLKLPNGIPSHDTINRVFQIIDARHFEALFIEWAAGFKANGGKEKVVAIDGKTLRGSKDTYHGAAALHIVHAWSVVNGMCIGQFQTDAKSNEITAIPQLLDMLYLEGAIVTIDAMGAQKDIAQKIVNCKADYILAVKGNQEALLEDVQVRCSTAKPDAESIDIDKGHGRIEERLCQVFAAGPIMLEDHPEWPSLRTVIKITAKRTIGDTQTVEARFYISSLPVGAPFNEYIRSHWGIENALHWSLDMTFKEDQQRKRCKFAAQNFSLVTKFALNILKKDKTKMSLIRKRLKAGWDWNYMIDLIKI